MIVAALAIATPAWATVNLGVTDLGGGVAAITYTRDVNVRAFALDINVGAGATITAISGYKTGESKTGSLGYGIFPASFRDHIVNPADPCWADPNYNPVAPGADLDALDGLGTAGITVELGSLYVMGGPNAPATSGTLCNITISGTGTVTVCIAANTTRGSVVKEDANNATTNLPVCGTVSFAPQYPACWDHTQCRGDATGDHQTTTLDFPAYRDSFFKSYPDPAYNPCGDFNRDGDVTTLDFPFYRDNFFKAYAQDCTPGGTWPPP